MPEKTRAIGRKLPGRRKRGNTALAASYLARLTDRAAGRAAAYLLGIHPPDAAEWTTKGHHDFVTEIDRTAERLIHADLRNAEPDSRILGEELSPEAGDLAGLVWIVDPLDGTTNYLHAYPWWSVSIAAVVDGEILAGTVFHVPAHRRYTAWRGGGAWCGPQQLAVSTISDPAQALIGTGFPFKTPDDLAPYLKQFARIVPATAGVRRAGSAALDLVSVAAGQLDGFWELTLAPWDKAAGVILIQEAGGVVTDLDGGPAPVAHGGIVAGNPTIHAWLMKQLRETRDERGERRDATSSA